MASKNLTAWRLSNGRVVFVSDGISGGRVWATYYRKSNGNLKRLVSKDLPLRKTRIEAQQDLGRWISCQRYALPMEVEA